MAVIVNGDGILTGISSLATDLTDITSGRGTITGVTTVGTLQLGAGVSISSPRSQQAAIFTNNTEFFTIDDAGRVGVGTITPNSDAHPENEKKINVGFITAKSIAGDIDARNVVVAGVSTFTDDVTFAGASANIIFDKSANVVKFNDNSELKVGTDGDFTINHNGSHTFLSQNGTGDLYIRQYGTSNSILFNGASNETFAKFTHNSSCELYFDNSKKIETSPSGVDVSGTLNVTGISTFIDGTKIANSGVTANKISLPDSSDGSLNIGVGSDFKFNHDGTHSYITEVGGGDLYIQGSDIVLRDAGTLEKHIEMTQNGSVDLYHNGSMRAYTASDGFALSRVNTFPNPNNTGSEITGAMLDIGGNLHLEERYPAGAYADRQDLVLRTNTGYGQGFADKVRFSSSGSIFLEVAGSGISFEPHGASNANLLDDYEEGTWTFAIVPGGGSYQYNYGQTGYYRKIGNTVFINAWVHLIVSSAVSGGITLTGLPFACQNRSRNWIPVGGYGHASGPSSAGLWLIATPNATTGGFYYNNTNYGAGTNLTAGNLGNSAELYINGSYFTDA